MSVLEWLGLSDIKKFKQSILEINTETGDSDEEWETLEQRLQNPKGSTPTKKQKTSSDNEEVRICSIFWLRKLILISSQEKKKEKPPTTPAKKVVEEVDLSGESDNEDEKTSDGEPAPVVTAKETPRKSKTETRKPDPTPKKVEPIAKPTEAKTEPKKTETPKEAEKPKDTNRKFETPRKKTETPKPTEKRKREEQNGKDEVKTRLGSDTEQEEEDDGQEELILAGVKKVFAANKKLKAELKKQKAENAKLLKQLKSQEADEFEE